MNKLNLIFLIFSLSMGRLAYAACDKKFSGEVKTSDQSVASGQEAIYAKIQELYQGREQGPADLTEARSKTPEVIELIEESDALYYEEIVTSGLEPDPIEAAQEAVYAKIQELERGLADLAEARAKTPKAIELIEESDALYYDEIASTLLSPEEQAEYRRTQRMIQLSEEKGSGETAESIREEIRQILDNKVALSSAKRQSENPKDVYYDNLAQAVFAPEEFARYQYLQTRVRIEEALGDVALAKNLKLRLREIIESKAQELYEARQKESVVADKQGQLVDLQLDSLKRKISIQNNQLSRESREEYERKVAERHAHQWANLIGDTVDRLVPQGDVIRIDY